MKLKLSVVAVSGALAALAANAAFAQVTMSGRMDAAIRHTAKVAPGAANTTITEDGGANTIKFAISEDITKGLKAVADIGLRFDIANGMQQSSNARPLMQGESRIGLVGSFGTLKFGRGLTAVQAPIGGGADPWGVTTVGTSQYAYGFASDYAAGGEARIDQGIFYNAPVMGGLGVSFSYSPRKLAAPAGAATADTATAQGTSAVTEIVSNKTHRSIHLGYNAGPMSLNIGHEQNRVGDKMTPIWANYDFGMIKLYAHHNTVKGGTAADRAGVTFAAASSGVQSGAMASVASAGAVAALGKINNRGFGAVIPVNKETGIRVGYSRHNGSGASGQLGDQKIALGIRYDLSKRTYMHANTASQTRKNNTGTRPDRDNTTQRFFDAGVVHTF